jgi:hypothetical protein
VEVASDSDRGATMRVVSMVDGGDSEFLSDWAKMTAPGSSGSGSRPGNMQEQYCSYLVGGPWVLQCSMRRHTELGVSDRLTIGALPRDHLDDEEKGPEATPKVKPPPPTKTPPNDQPGNRSPGVRHNTIHQPH